MTRAAADSEPAKAPVKVAETDAFSLQVKRLGPHATIPTRGSPCAAGYDLYSAHDVTILAEGKALVKTDIAVAIPDGCYGRVGEVATVLPPPIHLRGRN